MKTRIIIKSKTDVFNDSIIILKNIEYVIINNIIYYRKDVKFSLNIQNFYNFISKNKNEISEIKINIKYNKKIIRLKNGYFHSTEFPAYENLTLSSKYYFINGYHISKDNWLLNKRKIHIQNIMQIIKK
jgi:hypothetical protein